MNIAGALSTSLTGSEQGVQLALPSCPSWMSFPFLRKSKNIYDAKSQLTAATHTFQSNESYSYDNNRLYDDIQNGLASPDGGNVVLDFADPDGSGQQSIALAKRYLYGEVVDQILAQEDVTKNLSATDRVLWQCQLGGIAWVWSRSVTMLVASVASRERCGSCGDMWLSRSGEQREVKAQSDLYGCEAA